MARRAVRLSIVFPFDERKRASAEDSVAMCAPQAVVVILFVQGAYKIAGQWLVARIANLAAAAFIARNAEQVAGL